MKHNKNLKNKDIKRIAYSVFAIGTAFMLVVLFITLRQAPFTLQELNYILPQIFYYVMICLVMVVLFVFIAFMMFKSLDSKAVKTTIRLTSKKITDNMTIRNSNYIYYYLQVFSFDVIRRNNQLLRLPLQGNVSSLIPKGYTRSVRNDCVFYRYELIAPERPDYDDTTLKQVLQGFINQELVSYGIQGLSSKFQNTFSVFLDRIFYDGVNRILTIDILYVDNQNSLLYLKKAMQRDKKHVKNAKAINRLLKLLSDR